MSTIEFKKVLLCPPQHYDIHYEINPWMDIKNKVNKDKAHQEYQALRELYVSLGIEVVEMEPHEDLPDMVFTANSGSPHGTKFLLSNFKHDQRKKESALTKVFFERLGFEIKELPSNIFFEGQGDLLSVGDKYFYGWGKRSDYNAKSYIEDFLSASVIDLELVDPYYYHLDTCFAPLDTDTVVINPRSFSENSLKKISEIFNHVITTNEEDNNKIACNLISTRKNVVISKGISDDLKNTLTSHGYTIHEVSMEEFRKSGGSVKCLTLEFF